MSEQLNDRQIIRVLLDLQRAMKKVHIQPRTCATVTNRCTAKLSRTVRLNTNRTKQLRLGSINIGTLRGRANEVAEMLYRRPVHIACCQEVKQKAEGAGYIEREMSQYKAFWTFIDDCGFVEVVILSEERMDQDVLSAKRFSHRLMSVWLKFDNVISTYAPQRSLDEKTKNKFYDDLHEIINSIDKNELLIIGGDFNGSVGETAYGHPKSHGGHRYGLPNNKRIHLLDLSECH